MTVLIVDDVEINRCMLEDILFGDFSTLTASNGIEAVNTLELMGDGIDLVLLDIAMPGMDGFAVMTRMALRGWLLRTPVIVISGENTREVEERCLALGASDFIHKPFEPGVVRRRIRNVAQLYEYKRTMESRIAAQTDTLTRQNEQLRAMAKQLRTHNEALVDTLGTAAELHGAEGRDHIRRIKGYTRILAESMLELYPECGLTSRQISLIVSASALHDVGKCLIPDHILLKPGSLAPEELEVMKTHTSGGADFLLQLEGVWGKEYGRLCYEICRYHHERDDGRGYPDGLKGDSIPLSAQLVSVADAYDTLISGHCCQQAHSPDEAYRLLQRGACGEFSPRMLDCLRHARRRLEALAGKEEDHP